ncbi:MAG TPA: hypothetical protein VJ464_13320 [Blastocatellia bacterium]|nr:hypothetical protein [Blastocatellia bacterium]
MRKAIYLAALLLASMFGPKFSPSPTAQVKTISTTATVQKAKALREETRAINECLERYNRVLQDAGVWAEIPPEKTLPIVQEIQGHWQKIEEIYLHYRESP